MRHCGGRSVGKYLHTINEISWRFDQVIIYKMFLEKASIKLSRGIIFSF